MEPTVETLVLHPAVLIASGFEAITSRQVRFLHAHREHFHTKTTNLNETLSIVPKHFDLGGILNPCGYLVQSEEAYQQCAEELEHFPYLTRRAILRHFYQQELTTIWSELLLELFTDLSQFCVQHKLSRCYFVPNTKVIHELYSYSLYHKIAALHLCGLGSKLCDAFDYVFKEFKKYENAMEPITNYECRP